MEKSEESKMLEILNTQINGVGGKGGFIDEMMRLRDRVDALHTKLTLGIGFLTALQFLLPFVYPQVVKALSAIGN
jgi:hypothetical protein